MVWSNHSHIAKYFASASGRPGAAYFLSSLGRGVVRQVGHHRGVPDEEGRWLFAGLRVTLALLDKVRDGLKGLTADDEPAIAVAPGAGRWNGRIRRRIGGHAVGKAAVGKMTFPELAGLE